MVTQRKWQASNVSMILPHGFHGTEVEQQAAPSSKGLRDIFCFVCFYLKIFISFFMRVTESERGRDIGTGRSRLHAGSLMGDSIPDLRIRPWAEGSTKPLSHPGCPLFLSKQKFYHITNSIHNHL